MKISKELISESEIQSKINEIGDQINEDYEGEDLLIIGILKGAFITISDLAKRLKVDVSFDFMSVSSYEGTETSGQVKIEKDLVLARGGGEHPHALLLHRCQCRSGESLQPRASRPDSSQVDSRSVEHGIDFRPGNKQSSAR